MKRTTIPDVCFWGNDADARFRRGFHILNGDGTGTDTVTFEIGGGIQVDHPLTLKRLTNVWNTKEPFQAALRSKSAKIVADLTRAALNGVNEQDATVIRFGRRPYSDRKVGSPTFANVVEVLQGALASASSPECLIAEHGRLPTTRRNSARRTVDVS
jgi:hypothetical protein